MLFKWLSHQPCLAEGLFPLGLEEGLCGRPSPPSRTRTGHETQVSRETVSRLSPLVLTQLPETREEGVQEPRPAVHMPGVTQGQPPSEKGRPDF